MSAPNANTAGSAPPPPSSPPPAGPPAPPPPPLITQPTMSWAELGAAVAEYQADLFLEHLAATRRGQGPPRGQWTAYERVVEATNAWVDDRDELARREAAYMVVVNRNLGRGP